jgi:glyoxylase-like metal-dependent hydrolase (beta-lactamase superfamily II)
VLPPFGYDFDQQRASLDMLRREHPGGTAIVPGHDADVFQQLLANPL